MPLIVLLLLLCATNPSKAGDYVSSDPSDSKDTLLKAINFALTGHDGITYGYADRRECRVTRASPSAQPDVQAVETFYLNNVDASRITFKKMVERSQYDTTNFTRIELHGESVVRENAFAPQPPTLQPLLFTDVTLDLSTAEYDRLVRAWHYIYSHGCRGAKSSF